MKKKNRMETEVDIERDRRREVKEEYNHSVHSTIGFPPFKIVYGFDFFACIRVSLDGNCKAQVVRHFMRVCSNRLKRGTVCIYATKANKRRKHVVFQPEDWAKVRMHKERFLAP
jgi:hypothetical protein